MTGTGTATVTVTAFQLTPSTRPGEIIENQLAALRDGDIESVYKFASPGNKKQTGDVATFAKMVQSGPYRYVYFSCSVRLVVVSDAVTSMDTRMV